MSDRPASLDAVGGHALLKEGRKSRDQGGERGHIQWKSGIIATLWSTCPARRGWDGRGSRIRRLRRSPRAARTQDVSPTDTDGFFGPHRQIDHRHGIPPRLRTIEGMEIDLPWDSRSQVSGSTSFPFQENGNSQALRWLSPPRWRARSPSECPRRRRNLRSRGPPSPLPVAARRGRCSVLGLAR